MEGRFKGLEVMIPWGCGSHIHDDCRGLMSRNRGNLSFNKAVKRALGMTAFLALRDRKVDGELCELADSWSGPSGL